MERFILVFMRIRLDGVDRILDWIIGLRLGFIREIFREKRYGEKIFFIFFTCLNVFYIGSFVKVVGIFLEVISGFFVFIICYFICVM